MLLNLNGNISLKGFNKTALLALANLTKQIETNESKNLESTSSYSDPIPMQVEIA